MAAQGPDASPAEKVYYVLSGELTLIAGGKESVLGATGTLAHRP